MQTSSGVETPRLEPAEEIRERLVSHPVYGLVTSRDRLRIFMEHHVYAVWDFMSLVKRLERELTRRELPWTPSENKLGRLIYEIVMSEEFDTLPDGSVASHFEAYLQAMEKLGANTRTVKAFLGHVEAGSPVMRALEEAGAPEIVRPFVRHTMELALGSDPLEVAAAFFGSREDVIPAMFTQFLDSLGEAPGADLLRWYFHRHIELDGDSHGPMADALLSHLVGDDPARRARADEARRAALESRVALWDALAARLSEAG